MSLRKIKSSIIDVFKLLIGYKKVYYTSAERKKMLKNKSKNELIQMIIKNEIVISNMMKKFGVTNPKEFL